MHRHFWCRPPHSVPFPASHLTSQCWYCHSLGKPCCCRQYFFFLLSHILSPHTVTFHELLFIMNSEGLPPLEMAFTLEEPAFSSPDFSVSWIHPSIFALITLSWYIAMHPSGLAAAHTSGELEIKTLCYASLCTDVRVQVLVHRRWSLRTELTLRVIFHECLAELTFCIFSLSSWKELILIRETLARLQMLKSINSNDHC